MTAMLGIAQVRAGLVALTLAACSSDGGSKPPMATDSACPPTSTLTYDNFGKPFMQAYCTRCHASTLHGDDRQGAPVFHDFDSLVGILQVANHVDSYAAAGPSAENDRMPNEGPVPTLDERYRLGEWLACERAALIPPDAALAEPDATP